MTENMTLHEEIERDRAFVPAGEYVVVKVIDEGKGIPPEIMSRIFVPFYTTKRQGEGTGLGLSTAYGIVKQTGGYIFADSQVGEGTQFSLLFPHHTAEVADVVVAPAPVAIPLTEPRGRAAGRRRSTGQGLRLTRAASARLHGA